MSLNGAAPSTPPASDPGPLVIESSTATFRQDVIDASLETPILVDFWAPWCGPCRQLTPALEKVTAELGGRIKLVKVNIDENQALAAQMGIQSIPAVFAFSGGRPVDGFMGAIPESEVRRFAQHILAQVPEPAPQPGSIEEQLASALAAGEAALAAHDLGQAAEIFGMVLQHAPDNQRALYGMTKVYLAANDLEPAQAMLDMVSEEGRKDSQYASLVSALRLAREAGDLSETAELEQRIAADPDDHQARLDLAVVLNAKGKRLEAAEALIAQMRRDRSWNEDASRKKLLEFFEAWGPKDPATQRGRRLLSGLLFS